jgi:hypothetical protein
MIKIGVVAAVVKTTVHHGWPGVRPVGIPPNSGVSGIIDPDVLAVVNIYIDVAPAFIDVHLVVAKISAFAGITFLYFGIAIIRCIALCG